LLGILDAPLAFGDRKDDPRHSTITPAIGLLQDANHKTERLDAVCYARGLVGQKGVAELIEWDRY
jgi:hypothetical protein